MSLGQSYLRYESYFLLNSADKGKEQYEDFLQKLLTDACCVGVTFTDDENVIRNVITTVSKSF